MAKEEIQMLKNLRVKFLSASVVSFLLVFGGLGSGFVTHAFAASPVLNPGPGPDRTVVSVTTFDEASEAINDQANEAAQENSEFLNSSKRVTVVRVTRPNEASEAINDQANEAAQENSEFLNSSKRITVVRVTRPNEASELINDRANEATRENNEFLNSSKRTIISVSIIPLPFTVIP
jgi:hypothetical protein